MKLGLLLLIASCFTPIVAKKAQLFGGDVYGPEAFLSSVFLGGICLLCAVYKIAMVIDKPNQDLRHPSNSKPLQDMSPNPPPKRSSGF